MGKIQDLPKYDRPREKARRFGIDKLSNEELIALLLGTGTKELSVMDLSHQLLDESHGLVNLFTKPYTALLSVHGIGPGKALILSACFELSKRYDASMHLEEKINSDILYQRYMRKLRLSDKELFIIVIVNRSGKIIHEETLYKGTDKRVECSPEEIIRKVIIHGGDGFYLIHNHPSGVADPSTLDLSSTLQIASEANKMHISLLDHLIIGGNGYWSYQKAMYERSLLSN